ncbi:hypothetical protein ACLOJK_025261 [Asimina triloba]
MSHQASWHLSSRREEDAARALKQRLPSILARFGFSASVEIDCMMEICCPVGGDVASIADLAA